MWYNSDYNKRKLEELKKLKGFFESCVKESDKTKSVAGHFGAGYSVFFGNAIQYNSFDIPYDAMRLIYEANKERIENEIEQLQL
jgi:hypothetical protein